MHKEKVAEPDYEDALEKLARGKITKEQTILSKSYLDFVTKELESKGCIVNKKLNMIKLRTALKEKVVEIEIFNKPLWNEIEELNF